MAPKNAATNVSPHTLDLSNSPDPLAASREYLQTQLGYRDARADRGGVVNLAVEAGNYAAGQRTGQAAFSVDGKPVATLTDTTLTVTRTDLQGA